MKKPKPDYANFVRDADVKILLEEHKKKTGASFSFVINESVREYLKKKIK